jgi:hypothetical protein
MFLFIMGIVSDHDTYRSPTVPASIVAPVSNTFRTSPSLTVPAPLPWFDLGGCGLETRIAKRYTNIYGGDMGSTGVGSQSGMPGFCYPVKQTDLQI